MSSSLPTIPATLLDVPSVQDVSAEFVYNFFTADECVSALPAQASSSQLGRVPRYIQIKFKPATTRRDLSRSSSGLISSNLSKLVLEEHYSDQRYTGVSFEPIEFLQKLHDYVSGSTAAGTPGFPTNAFSRAAAQSQAAQYVPTAFLARALVAPEPAQQVTLPVAIRAQFDSRFSASAVSTSLSDPFSTHGNEMLAVFSELVRTQKRTAGNSSYSSVSRSEFEPPVQYVDVSFGDESQLAHQSSTTVVGYIVYRTEVGPYGEGRESRSFVIEQPSVSSYLDTEVKYGTEYAYSIRTVALAKYVAVVRNEDGEDTTALASVLVASKPSTTRYVRTVEFQPPAPPADVAFTWDYDAGKLCVSWSFPVDTQRDVKKFQVFRRQSVNDPFELIALHDFDDSAVRFPDPENDQVPLPLVAKSRSPKLSYIDDEFTKDSSYIYAVACTDAHGMSSGYSQQFAVSFDRFKNSLAKVLVSAAGAPKPIPNFMLDDDLFLDSVSEARRDVDLAFCPDAYAYSDSSGAQHPLVSVGKSPSRFVFQFINTDTQELRSVSMPVIDSRSTVERLPAPSVSMQSIASRMKLVSS